MSALDKLITEYRIELVEDHHSPGSGRYGVRIVLPVDISIVFPYLNAMMDDTQYDQKNSVLIGVGNHRRCAFRPREIQTGTVKEFAEASSIAEEVVEMVNRIWREHERIDPSFKERKLPAIYDIYKLLPKTNCRECGYATCLACAADIRNGVVPWEKCPLLLKPEYAKNRDQICALFPPDN